LPLTPRMPEIDLSMPTHVTICESSLRVCLFLTKRKRLVAEDTHHIRDRRSNCWLSISEIERGGRPAGDGRGPALSMVDAGRPAAGRVWIPPSYATRRPAGRVWHHWHVGWIAAGRAADAGTCWAERRAGSRARRRRRCGGRRGLRAVRDAHGTHSSFWASGSG
jgi:hypothetical protein